MTEVSVDRVSAELDALRRHTADAVAADGFDEHQVEINELVWCHAHVEAARAMHEWAGVVGKPVARDLAELADLEAAAQFGVGPRESRTAIAIRLAELAPHLEATQDLGDSGDHRLFRATLREFADREIAPHAREIHRQDLDVPEHIIMGAARLGLFALSVPAEFGGAQEEADSKSMLIATEELSRASLAAGGSLITRPEILVRALLRGGTTEQKRRWLPVIASGEKLVAVAVTEADHGSDVAGLKCRATRLPGGEWEINGAKLWCTFAGRAELLMVLCRTADTGRKGLSVFVAEKPAFRGHAFEHRQPAGGVLRGRAIPTIGYRGMHTYELVFEGFRVPIDALVGEHEGLNRGFYLQLEGFSVGRLQTAGRAVGVMQSAFEDALHYAKEREAFGSPIFSYQLIRSKIGLMALRLHASRQLSYRAARLLDEGHGQIEAAIAKLYASRMSELVTREAIQIFGATGYSEETDAARNFLDARVLSIFEGTEEVLSLRVIGKALLKGVA
jgi:(2S)-methylsuccinyl-CoA dehydrogenase